MVWNVRGLGLENHQAEVRRLIRDNKINFCGLVETRIACENIDNAYNKINRSWMWFSNADRCGNWVRILVGWDPRAVKVNIIGYTEQVIHCDVNSLEDDERYICSFVYGFTKIQGRRLLWKELVRLNGTIQDLPWVVLGDFNTILHPNEKSVELKRVNYGMEDFSCCVNEINLFDIAMSGLFFTWNQKLGKSDGILEKLDRVMGNQNFVDMYPAAFAKFLPYFTSDHSPALLIMASKGKSTPKPFKFWNFLAAKEEFLPIVKEGWDKRIEGCKMFRVVTKLKGLKKPLRKLKYAQGNLHDKVEKLRAEVERIQKAVEEDPFNEELRSEEGVYVKEYKIALADEEYMLKQKSRVHWLKVGDQNTKFFHKSVKNRECRNRVNVIKDLEGTEHSGDKVGDALVKYFKGIMGLKCGVEAISDPDSLFLIKLNKQEAEQMVVTVSRDEVKKAMFQIADEKAPGPDGYTAKFFKAAWGIIGEDIVDAVLEFFINGKILKEINATIISVVPKVKVPNVVNQFRPIACCNVIYKCISKVLCNRLKNVLGKLVSTNQSAFVPGRLISDNILLSQELVKGYEWKQGDPISPYLFTLVMEVLNLMLIRRIKEFKEFKYHWKCGKLKLTHLCFADDLFIFSGADVHSIEVIKDALNEFSAVSGLVPNMNKSDIIFGNVNEMVQKQIQEILPFNVGKFPMKYLGIPLSSKMLYLKDCKVLIDKVKARITDWKVKFLSFAGRLQLIKSVLSSITIYWASLYILPVAISEEIERLLSGFLWSQGRGNKGMARICWEEVCKSKCQGGLNISSLKIQNIALMSKHIWNVLSDKDTMWIKWVKEYKLCGKSIWEVSESRCDSWSWKQVLQHRSLFREKFCAIIGNGEKVRVWQDLWHEKGILANLISRRDIKATGYDVNTKVAEVYDGVRWRLPQEWNSKYEWLMCSGIPQFNLMRDDKFMWKMNDGSIEEFSVRRVYKSLCLGGLKKRWSDIVWFSQNIPRHAFIIWLAFKYRLLTQDRLLNWGYEGELKCALCNRCPDSHNHLFFECEVALAVWKRCKVFSRLEGVPNEGVAVSQLEYSRAIGSLMYAMISTRPDIAYAVGKLSRYTSNPGASHWQAMNRVFRYLKGTMKYGLTYTGFPSVLEGYSDASWINNKEDHSSASGWTFLLG
ncbi:putative RNA-directed DNA polymerase transcription factor bZIP family [Helianthus annuus]|nr:putative RNA-directed DNA polymerase transcription factor bZIP family [Helianthus annuus]